MPDLILISGDFSKYGSVDGVANLQLLVETGRMTSDTQFEVSALADAAAQAAVSALGLTVTVVKTDAQFTSDMNTIYTAVNSTPYDFSTDPGGVA